jgi:TetR/AcrR family transcriptional regulator, fatty acid metabolism regulator protein
MARLSTEERKEQIIDEAIKIIHEAGYAALSIRELSQRVGISEPAIYRHFVNKDDIIKGILDRVYHFGNSIFEKLKSETDFSEKIKTFMLFHFEFFENCPEMTSIVFSEDIFLHNKSLTAKLGEIMNQRKRMLKKIFDDARRDSYAIEGDVDDLSLVILGIVRVAVLEWRLSGFRYPLRERGMKLLKTMEGTGLLVIKESKGK